MMFNHVSVHVSDLEASKRFYDDLLSILDIKRYSDEPHRDAWAYGSPECTFWIHAPEHVAVGSGHICFSADSRETVEAFFRAAPELGGKQESPPGEYEAYGVVHYTALVSDRDGNFIEAVYPDTAQR